MNSTDFRQKNNNFPLLAAHFQSITVNALINDSTAVYNWYVVLKDKIGCIGFCLGGRASFVANSALPLSASVSFYGGYTHAVSHLAATLHGPQLFFRAGKDQHIKPEHVHTVIESVKNAGKDYINVGISYADHGFFCDARAAYHAEAARDAWCMVKSFLKNKLG